MDIDEEIIKKGIRCVYRGGDRIVGSPQCEMCSCFVGNLPGCVKCTYKSWDKRIKENERK